MSEDFCHLFDDMYLQKCYEYFGGELIGFDKNGQLYKGIVCFMIVWFEESIGYVIKSSPETTINATWLRDELFECLDILYQCDFNVCGAIIYNNRKSKMSTFRKLLERNNENIDNLCVNYQCKKLYLFYDSVHLIKNIGNNLLSCKRFIFLSFTLHRFRDIDLQSGELSWKMFYNYLAKSNSIF